MMCSIPPVPPPPPILNNNNSANTYIIDPTDYSDICQWASEPELRKACAINKICLNQSPFKHKYKNYGAIMQVGPTCGLVALSMLLNGEVSPEELLKLVKTEGYSNNGEMFSCQNMAKLAEKALSLAGLYKASVQVRKGLYCEETIQELLNGAALLVAYDADCNHSPCLRQGHTAHWALVCGIIIIDDPKGSYTSDPKNTYILCRHGKSRNLAAWPLAQLDCSNKNLYEFSPKKKEDGLSYILPDGGMGGENGLRDQFIILNGL